MSKLDVPFVPPVGIGDWLALEAAVAEMNYDRERLLEVIQECEAEMIADPNSVEARYFLEGLRHAAHLVHAVCE